MFRLRKSEVGEGYTKYISQRFVIMTSQHLQLRACAREMVQGSLG